MDDRLLITFTIIGAKGFSRHRAPMSQPKDHRIITLIRNLHWSDYHGQSINKRHSILTPNVSAPTSYCIFEVEFYDLFLASCPVSQSHMHRICVLSKCVHLLSLVDSLICMLEPFSCSTLSFQNLL